MKQNLSTASEFALTRHGLQTYGDMPYRVHLEAVVRVLQRFGHTDNPVLMVAWLHDVLEDTSTTYEELKDLFGEAIADSVQALTNVSDERWTKESRLERTLHQIAQDPTSRLVKLADRISNIEMGIMNRGFCFNKYIRQHDQFSSFLKKGFEYHAMWTYLDSLIQQSVVYRSKVSL